MYLLDTNVVSELRKASTPKIDRNVKAWARSIPASDLFLSAITILEIELGILLIDRRDSSQGKALRTWFEEQVLFAFSGRILAVDTTVARKCASLHVPDPCADRDAFIAATALVHGMVVVTRNLAPFEPTGVAVLNPWTK